MKQKILLKTMLLLCALVVGSGNVWATDLTTSDFVLPSPQFSENFNSLSATTETGNISNTTTLTSQTKFGIFDKLYIGKAANTCSIESNATFDSKVLSLSQVNNPGIIASITGKTFGTTGAFSFKVLKTSKCYIGLYGGTDNNTTNKSYNAIYLANNGSGTLTFAELSSGSTSWVSIGSYSTDIIEVHVVYNTTNSATTYGNSIALGSKKAHIFVNGTCVMNGAGTAPKDFTIPVTTLTVFRVCPQGSGQTAIIDDVNIYNSLPTAPAVDLSTFEFANTTPSVTLSKVSSTYDASYTQTVSVAPAAYDGTITYSLDEENSTFDVENDAYIDEGTGEITISTASNLASAKTIVVKASATATAKYNKPSDATYTLTVNPAPAGVGTPYFSQSAGSYYYGTSFTISCANSDKIYYTTDGTDPSKTNGTLYSGEISIISTVTVKAIGYDGEDSGDIGSVTYTLKAPEVPTFSFSAGGVTEGTDVELEMGDGGTKVVYTTDGSTPTASSTTYSSAITINYPMTIKAATVDGGNNLSSIVTNAYTIVVIKAVPLWSEDFTGYSKDAVPDGGTYSYNCTDGGSTTKIYSEELAGGASPELLVSRSNGSFKATIPLDNNVSPLILTYKANNNNLGVSVVSTTSGASAGEISYDSEKKIASVTISGVSKSMTSLDITFTNSKSGNTRLDNIQLTYNKQFSTEPVTVSSAGFATYCSENALDFTDTGIEAYVGAIASKKLTFTPITQVPANTGLLLVASGGATKNIPVIASTPVASSCLTGVNVATTIDANDYILNVVDGNAGFYKAGSYTTLGAHKAYITAATASSVKEFLPIEFSFDDADGINSLTPALYEGEGAIYNVAGQRLSKMQKGINIVNGKKVLK